MAHKFTDDEKSQLSQYLDIKTNLLKRLRDLSQEMEEVGKRIREMDVKFSTFCNTRNQVLMLPTEVICLIFIFAQIPDRQKKSGKKVTKNTFLMEVIVSHVCHRWRSISLGFPALWTSFRYNSNKEVRIRPLQIYRFDCYAERSADLPLHIWFDFTSIRSSDDTNMQLLVEKAIHHARRWQRFAMYSREETAMHPFHLFPDVSAPMLEYLSLIPGSNFYRPGDTVDYSRTRMTRKPILKGGAPKLTYLMLGALAVHSLPTLSNITILQIEQEDIGANPVFELAPFLELLSLPSLTRLSLRGNLIQPFAATYTVHMPNLKSFRAAALNAIWDLLASIRAPQLDTLIIQLLPYSSPIDPPFMKMGSTFPALNTLYLLTLEIGPQIVPALIHMTSQATHVVLSDRNIRTILSCFAGVAWSRLKKITCNIESVASINDCVTFAMNHPSDLITYRILPHQFEDLDAELEVLRMVSLVIVAEQWEVDEPFWSHGVDRYVLDYGNACFPPKI